MKKKELICKVELIANYLWSLFASANLWELEELVLNKNIFFQKDIKFLYQNRDLIRWGNGRCGLFTVLAFFYPLSEKELTRSEYLILLNQMEKGLNQKESFYLEKVCVTKQDNYEEFDKNQNVIHEMIDIFRRNLVLYEENQWEDDRNIILKEEKRISLELNQDDLIGKWEDFLKIDFPSKSFEIVLTLANMKMPSANNLSKKRYNFYLFDNLVNFLQHEIGTNLLEDSYRALYTDPDLNTTFIKRNNVIWLAFESLAEFIKGILFNQRDEWNGQMFGGGSFYFDWFFNYYQKHLITPLIESPILIMKGAVLAFQNEKTSCL